jgi:hypothetical protein
MKVKDLKALLATYNQDAEVRVIAHRREYDFTMILVGTVGVTRDTTKEVGIYVDELCGHEESNNEDGR